VAGIPGFGGDERVVVWDVLVAVKAPIGALMEDAAMLGE
jgi:hypothetical protein